jgi:hypothetical protein
MYRAAIGGGPGSRQQCLPLPGSTASPWLRDEADSSTNVSTSWEDLDSHRRGRIGPLILTRTPVASGPLLSSAHLRTTSTWYLAIIPDPNHQRCHHRHPDAMVRSRRHRSLANIGVPITSPYPTPAPRVPVPLFRPLEANPETGLLSPPIVYGRHGNFFKILFQRLWDPCKGSPYIVPLKSVTRFVGRVHALAKGSVE